MSLVYLLTGMSVAALTCLIFKLIKSATVARRSRILRSWETEAWPTSDGDVVYLSFLEAEPGVVRPIPEENYHALSRSSKAAIEIHMKKIGCELRLNERRILSTELE